MIHAAHASLAWWYTKELWRFFKADLQVVECFTINSYTLWGHFVPAVVYDLLTWAPRYYIYSLRRLGNQVTPLGIIPMFPLNHCHGYFQTSKNPWNQTSKNTCSWQWFHKSSQNKCFPTRTTEVLCMILDEIWSHINARDTRIPNSVWL
jgi:hypothetical protein